MRIAIFDYKVVAGNPAGGCHLQLLESLSAEHEFTVFAVEFENPCPEKIRWVRVPAPTRPLALLFIAFHLLAPACYWLDRLLRWRRFDSVQIIESNLTFGTMAYAHFCHRYYLKNHWRRGRSRGPRGWLRWLDHALHAVLEPWVYGRVNRIVVPSRGMARDLSQQYPCTTSKTQVIENPVDVERMRRPGGFDQPAFRRSLGILPEDVVLVFAALGHFERKGLPAVLEAMRKLGGDVKLLVVGGEQDLVGAYRRRVTRMGLEQRVIFAGMQADIRPYLWASDAFALPSCYETFSLAAFEAAAAGLPLLVSRLNGVEDLLRDRENGFLTDSTPEGVADGVLRFLALSSTARREMGLQACRDAARYGREQFAARWRLFYGTSHVV